MKKVYHSSPQFIRLLSTPVLTVVFSLLLTACNPGTGGTFESNSSTGAPPSSGTTPPPGGGTVPDTISPVLNITAPVATGGTYATASASVTVTGTASDNVGLAQISWSNSKGGSGNTSVSGASTTRSFNIALLSGSNVITMTALDTSGNSTQRQITVTYTPPTSNSAALAWDAASVSNFSGYRVYYGTAPGVYLQSFGQGISVGNTTTYTLMGLSNATRYYFAVTVFDTLGNESTYSNETYKDIP